MEKETLDRIVKDHQTWLQTAGEQGKKAGLIEAILHGANYNLEQLQRARNVSKHYLTKVATPKTAEALYKKQIDDAKKEIEQLERIKKKLEHEKEQLSAQADQDENKKKTLENELNEVKTALAAKQQAEQQAQERQSRLTEMEAGIEPILAAIKEHKETIQRYKKQSLWLLILGGSCFVLSIGYLCYFIYSILLEIPDLTFVYFAPAVIFVLIGTGLLRHDWKIRQLILKLIEQNHQIDIATGLLKSSLGLSNLATQQDEKGVPRLVEETFDAVRKALLFREKTNHNETMTETNNLKEIVDLLVKK